MKDISQFARSASKLPGRATNAPDGMSRGQPIRHAAPPGKPLSRATSAPASGADPQAAIAALEARVASLEAQLATLLGGISVTPAGNVSISTGARVEIQAAVIALSGGIVNLDSALVNCDGVVKCDTLVASTVTGASYTPGAGNIW